MRCYNLGGVKEIWSLVAELLDLILGLALDPVIALTLLAQPVLTLEHEVHEEGSAEKEQELVCKHNTVASPVARLLLRVVDIGGHNTIHVTPADNNTNHDTTLERSLDIVRCPGQSVGDSGVDSCGAEESAGVLDLHIVGREQHGETDASNEGHEHVAVATPFRAIGNPSDDDSHGSSDGIRRDRQELGLSSFVTHTEKNRRQEEGEAVQWAQATHVDDGIAPSLPVLERSENVSAIDASNFGTRLSVELEAALSSKLLIRREEGGSVRKVEYHPPTENAHKHGHKTFDDDCSQLANVKNGKIQGTNRSSAILRIHQRHPSG